MANAMKDRSFWTLVLVIIIGVVIGSYLNNLIRALIPGDNNVVKTFFTTNVTFGVGDFGSTSGLEVGIDDGSIKHPVKKLSPLVLDFAAIKFQLGLQVSFSFMSIIGIFLGLYMLRWFR
jgi:hypothetical protein